MNAWERLSRELDRWAAGAATFWWRDDDAAAPSPVLARLLSLGPQPLALAVIPALAVPALAQSLAGRPVDVLQHGFSHRNHEPSGRKKIELGAARPAEVVLAELARGWARLSHLFGPRALPVLVPPWNRIDEGLVGLLAAGPYVGLSTYGPRPAPATGAPWRVNNTHIDIIAWDPAAAFIGPNAAIDLAIGHLAARREGRTDAGEATGLLTHHLVMDADAFAFTAEFFARTARHPAVLWRSARDIFPAAMGSDG